jgi:hypothetical protein
MGQKHLTLFEMWKPACPPCGSSMLTVIMCSDVWSTVSMERWSGHYRTAAGEFIFYQNRVCFRYTAWFPTALSKTWYLSRNSPQLWVSKWRQEGSGKGYKPKEHGRSSFTPDNVQRVRDAILRSRTGHFGGRFSHNASRTAALAE